MMNFTWDMLERIDATHDSFHEVCFSDEAQSAGSGGNKIHMSHVNEERQCQNECVVWLNA